MSVVLNQLAAAELGLEEPVGAIVNENGRPYTVIGVIEDIHFSSLHREVGPLVVFGPDPFSSNRPNQVVTARLSSGAAVAAVEAIGRVWEARVPEQPMNLIFLDDRVQAQYTSERSVRTVASVSSLLAVLIACLGLFGLASFAARRRRREISVRKVFGAGVADIITLMTRDFVLPIGIAVVVAAPLAWLAAREWISTFAFRADVGPELFLAAVGIGAAFAMLPLLGQSVRAGMVPPGVGLRDD